jgi:C1A family cysteine protease
MNKSYLVTFLLAAIAAVALYNQQTDSAPYSFEQFKADYQKSYIRAGEEEYRKTIFLRNLVKIAEHNANKANTYEIGINQFTDLTNAEFQAIYLTLIVPKENNNIYIDTITPNADIDWQAAGKVTPVKNQAQCGSCWAFSATAAHESAILIAGKPAADLSEQQLVDCSRSYGNQGCNGGWMDQAFQYAKDKGLTSTSAYPYVARDQACKIDKGDWKVTGFVDVPGCDQVLNALVARTVSVAVDASVWSPYKSGVLSNCGTAVNHGVLLIGATDAYWRIKNSWGTGWGESGFIRLARGNTCAICSYPSYPTI